MKFFQPLIKLLSKPLIKEAFNEGFLKGVEENEEKRLEEKEKILIFQIQDSIGKKIICCPNEWADPLFGIITGYGKYYNDKQLMVEVTNVLTNEAVIVHPQTFFYTDELLTMTIIGLNPFQRWNLSCAKTHHLNRVWNKAYKLKEVMGGDELEYRLRECGFLFKNPKTSGWLKYQINRGFNGLMHNYIFRVRNKTNDLLVLYNKYPVKYIEFSSKGELDEFIEIVDNGKNIVHVK